MGRYVESQGRKLLPERHPTADFFVCDIFDALPKDDLASMEHPLFSLSTRADLRVLTYAHNDVTITVTPSVRGRATLFDKDILIYCISQLMAALNGSLLAEPCIYALTIFWLRPTVRPRAMAIAVWSRRSSGWPARGSPPI